MPRSTVYDMQQTSLYKGALLSHSQPQRSVVTAAAPRTNKRVLKASQLQRRTPFGTVPKPLGETADKSWLITDEATVEQQLAELEEYRQKQSIDEDDDVTRRRRRITAGEAYIKRDEKWQQLEEDLYFTVKG